MGGVNDSPGPSLSFGSARELHKSDGTEPVDQHLKDGSGRLGQGQNVVSPGMLDVSARRYGAWFQGHKPVSSHDVGLAFAKCVEGALTGQVAIVA